MALLIIPYLEAFIESGIDLLAQQRPEEAWKLFKDALKTWRSIQTSEATSYVHVYVGLTDCMLQMTYRSKVHKEQMKCLNKAKGYNERAREKVLDPDALRDVPIVRLDRRILMVREAQLQSGKEEINPGNAEKSC
jgi:hypothetical protein